MDGDILGRDIVGGDIVGGDIVGPLHQNICMYNTYNMYNHIHKIINQCIFIFFIFVTVLNQPPFFLLLMNFSYIV